MVRAFAFVAAAAAAVACRPAPTADPATVERLVRVEARLAALEKTLGGSGDGADAAPATPDVRMMRIESRLERITTFLKQAVPPEVDRSVVYAVPIDPRDPVVGPADAKVTVVEAFEFLCPYCAMVAPELDELRARYPRDVRVVSKYLLIHGEPAVPGGHAACAAAQQGAGKWEAFERAVWAAIWPVPGKPPSQERATAPELEKLAKGAGLDLARYRKDVASSACEGWIARSGDVLQRLGTGGTPTFYVNGKMVDATELQEAVAAAIAAVDASGVAPARYYQEVVLGRGATEAQRTSPFD